MQKRGQWLLQEPHLAKEVLQVTQGSLYPALHRLEKRGLLTSSWGSSRNNRRAKYYRLSARGRKALAEEELRWTRYVDAVAKITPREMES